MYLVVFKVEVRNHLQMVLDECVTFTPYDTFPFYIQLSTMNMTSTTKRLPNAKYMQKWVRINLVHKMFLKCIIYMYINTRSSKKMFHTSNMTSPCSKV